MERGQVEEAEALKKYVEEKQRSRRTEGISVEPRWFVREGEGWRFGGDYCELMSGFGGCWRGC